MSGVVVEAQHQCLDQIFPEQNERKILVICIKSAAIRAGSELLPFVVEEATNETSGGVLDEEVLKLLQLELLNLLLVVQDTDRVISYAASG